MFADKKFAGLILAVVFGIANASYGGGGFGGGIGGGGYGGGGFGGGIGGGYGDSYGPSKVEAAVNSNQKVRTYAVGTSNSGGRTTVVDINGGGGNLIMRFNGGGSNIEAVQNGIPGGVGRVQKQSLTAEPDMLIQNVQKPVIQKIRMHIQPLRQVIQEVRPAHEQIETVIAKGLDHGIGGGAGGYGGAGGAGGGGKY